MGQEQSPDNPILLFPSSGLGTLLYKKLLLRSNQRRVLGKAGALIPSCVPKLELRNEKT